VLVDVTLRIVMVPVVPVVSRMVSGVVPPTALPKVSAPVPAFTVRTWAPSTGALLAKTTLLFVVVSVAAAPRATGPP